MKRFFILLIVCLASVASVRARPTHSIPLWPDGAPGATGKTDKDIPTLTPYWPSPEKASGGVMVICPGGGYAGLAHHEGEVYARWLCGHGMACFVLKYRLGTAGYRHPIPLQDAARAVRTVRANAAAWEVDAKRIGIMGSSAGGHLASTLLTHFDAGKPDAADPVERESSRPDLGILCYPVITMFGEVTHAGSRNNLLGPDASPDLLREVSNERHVTAGTPPCFLFHTAEDKGVSVENSLLFASALKKAGVPFALHVFEKGPHGIGLGSRKYEPEKFHPWTADCLFWLREQSFVK